MPVKMQKARLLPSHMHVLCNPIPLCKQQAANNVTVEYNCSLPHHSHCGGVVLGDGSQHLQVPDVVAVGLKNPTDPDGTKSPLSEYNDTFQRFHWQRRRRMDPFTFPGQVH